MVRNILVNILALSVSFFRSDASLSAKGTFDNRSDHVVREIQHGYEELRGKTPGYQKFDATSDNTSAMDSCENGQSLNVTAPGHPEIDGCYVTMQGETPLHGPAGSGQYERVPCDDGERGSAGDILLAVRVEASSMMDWKKHSNWTFSHPDDKEERGITRCISKGEAGGVMEHLSPAKLFCGISSIREGLSSQAPTDVTVVRGCSSAKPWKSNKTPSQKQWATDRSRDGDNTSILDGPSSSGRFSRQLRDRNGLRGSDDIFHIIWVFAVFVWRIFRHCLSDSANPVLPVARATPLQLDTARRVPAIASAPGAEDNVSAAHEVELQPFIGEPTTPIAPTSAGSRVDGDGMGEGAVPIVHAVEVGALHRAVAGRALPLHQIRAARRAGSGGARGGEGRRDINQA